MKIHATEDQTHEFLKSAKSGRTFVVDLKIQDNIIGSCGIYPDENMNIATSLGWILHKDYWKYGYGTELCGQLRYGFEDFKICRIRPRAPPRITVRTVLWNEPVCGAKRYTKNLFGRV